MSFIILFSVSSIVGALLLWIGKGRLIFMPAFVIMLYTLDRIHQSSIKRFTHHFHLGQGILISRIITMIGMSMLLQSQHIGRIYNCLILISINSILLFTSYISQYLEGIKIFSRGLPGAWIISMLMAIIYYTIETRDIMIVLSIGTIRSLIIRYIIGKFPDLKEKDIIHVNHNKEITLYILLYTICYRMLGSHPSTIVLQLWCTTVCISLRQQFLAYTKYMQHEKQIGLTGRALLQGQKVLKRYESKQDSKYSIINTALSFGILPSQNGLRFLQFSQGILIAVLIVVSIGGLFYDSTQSLLRYRLGTMCFMITIFTLDRQDKFFEWYKKLSLIIMSSAFYLTLFYKTNINNTFIIASLGRNCLNMFGCLFYDSIVPFEKRIFNRHDLIFWMLWTSGTSIITLLSLGRLSLPGDVVFALGCIIIGVMSFFSYHIWKKYSIPHAHT